MAQPPLNPYAAPKHGNDDLGSEAAAAGSSVRWHPVYVVSSRKFTLLSVGTIGFYSFYWFFVQYRRQRDRGRDVSPFWRAVFPVFFVHDLFRSLRDFAQGRDVETNFNASAQAWFYIGCVVAGRISERLHVPGATAAGLFIFLCAGVPLHSAQMLANRAAGDPEGATNSSLTAWNILVLVIGFTLLAVTVIGLAMGE